MDGKGIDGIHVCTMYDILHRTYVPLEDLVDIAFFEDPVFRILLMLFG